jgi:predicted cobalt transporter CbtA
MSTAPAVPSTETTPPSFGTLLRAGLLGGAGAGLVGALVSWLVVEVPIRSALAIEEAREAAAEHGAAGHAHEELFTRNTQVIGGMLAVVLAGVVLGVVFAVVFARLRPELPGRTDFGRTLALALGGFVAVSLLPAIKYPANPPAVGDPDTVDTRTLYYISFLAASIALMAVVFALRQRMPARWPASWATTAGILLAVAGYAVLLLLWPPTPDAIPAEVPAALIWQFRLSSLAELAALWVTLGFVSGLVLERRTADAH